MFKKLKDYFSLQRRIQFEIIETLCTICLYLERDGCYDRNPYSRYFGSHFKSLKDLSEEIRDKEWGDIITDMKVKQSTNKTKNIF